jgi:chromosome segregation protein
VRLATALNRADERWQYIEKNADSNGQGGRCLNLRKIEISGFKSFMSRLELDFSTGITAILGPNGCGKSNVVDSIRWVLGEQRTRLLRNTKMENVLFNGTRLRKPLGMAEVYLTLSNEDHGLSVDYEEVTIGRKLYRSGASEYQINGESTRLKTIKGLLVDTGLGNNAYAIIERDMVDRVLSEKEQEKRNLLEEAAGVMRYRIQREEALRKIKLTEQDLVRLVDILQELDKELRSLKYQMAKARRYARLRDIVNVMEAALLKASLYDLLTRSDDLDKEKDRHENIRLADDNEITVRESRLQESRIRSSEFEHRLQELRETRYGLSSTLQQHEEKIAVHTERIAASRNRIVENHGEVERAHEKLGVLGGELERYRGEVAGRNDRLTGIRERLSEKEEALRGVARQLDEVRGELREKKQLALDLVEEKAKEESLREHLESNLAELTDKQAVIENQMGALSEEESLRVAELSRAEDAFEDARRSRDSRQAELEKLAGELDRFALEMNVCEAALSEAARSHAKLREKREFLEKVKREHTRWSDETLGRHESLSGVLSDLVRVDKPYRKCFEACLAPVLNGVVASSKEDAVSCLREFVESDSGRVQILYSGRFGGEKREVTGEGVVGSALSLVSFDSSVSGYLESYLADVVVAENTDAALKLVADGRAARVATLDGVFFDGPGRIIVAGADDVETTLLEYDAKLDELAIALEIAARSESELEQTRDSLAEGRSGVLRRSTETRETVAGVEKRVEELRSQRRDCELSVVRVKEKITALEASLAENVEALSQLRSRLDTNGRDAHVSGPRAVPDASTNERLGVIEELAVELEREKESLSETVGKLKFFNDTATTEIYTLQTKIRNVEKLDEELRQLIRAREEDTERCREQTTVSEEDITGLRSSISGHHSEKETVEKEIDSVNESYEEVKHACEDLEQELKQMKDQRDAKRENLERVSVEMASLEARISGILEKAQENFDQNLRPYVSDRTMFDPAEWENLDRQELETLKEKVDNFGPVNMLALDEYNEKKERFDFLTKQKDDLEEAKNTLTQAIRRINREARRLLRETFEQVRQNFKQTFLTLFDGGEVDLLFVDSDDPLEANIKIVANPKGKKLHDISSLSSGERALVALSLLFGIYLVKPSPFCVFDEVDAPLDDANIARFIRLLKSFTDRTQFIVITHNKKTMEAADNLYGVTMQEPGVSKLVSIRLDEAERFRRHQPTPQAMEEPQSAAPAA